MFHNGRSAYSSGAGIMLRFMLRFDAVIQIIATYRPSCSASQCKYLNNSSWNLCGGRVRAGSVGLIRTFEELVRCAMEINREKWDSPFCG